MPVRIAVAPSQLGIQPQAILRNKATLSLLELIRQLRRCQMAGIWLFLLFCTITNLDANGHLGFAVCEVDPLFLGGHALVWSHLLGCSRSTPGISGSENSP